MSDAVAPLVHCTMCGTYFERAQGHRACEGCFFSGGCEGVRCPDCGFDMPEHGAATGRIELTKMGEGRPAVLEDLRTADPATLRQLLALGFVPGTSVRVLQRTPAWRIDVGGQEVGMDERLVRLLEVRPA